MRMEPCELRGVAIVGILSPNPPPSSVACLLPSTLEEVTGEPSEQIEGLSQISRRLPEHNIIPAA